MGEKLQNIEFSVWIDNDACPRPIREIIFKATKRVGFSVKIVANSYMAPPRGLKVEVICVNSSFDAADDHIADHVNARDLVITADIPLAARVVAKQAIAINPRGFLYDEESINERLAIRNLSQELRSSGDLTGGPSAFGVKDINRFAALFDKTLTQRLKVQLSSKS